MGSVSVSDGYRGGLRRNVQSLSRQSLGKVLALRLSHKKYACFPSLSRESVTESEGARVSHDLKSPKVGGGGQADIYVSGPWESRRCTNSKSSLRTFRACSEVLTPTRLATAALLPATWSLELGRRLSEY